MIASVLAAIAGEPVGWAISVYVALYPLQVKKEAETRSPSKPLFCLYLYIGGIDIGGPLR